ncbi:MULTISPECIES: ABC transporter permease [Halorubrum]|uniref:ABC transporter n=1 Tax=Halorubrum hochstenium ATCC 700873 TaxID=1227481 RepID=M0F5U8_9EURY|nr:MULTISPECIES: ABC transporter permease subunit [Halorubrum]ELZ54698.1 ABC transporter [Halorubrum hochstenium ATCC 700873]
MSLPAVARKDLRETVQSRGMIALIALFSLLVSLLAFFVRPTAQNEQFATEVLLSVFVGPVLVTYLVPLVGVVVGYSAVSGERESGSLKLLLSLPHSRADVVFGKVVGRGAALSLAVFAGFLLPAAVLIVAPVTFNAGAFLGYTVFAAALGVVFVAISVGCSAASSTQLRALIASIGVYVLFVLLWSLVTGRLLDAAGPVVDALPASAAQIQVFLRVSNPTTAIEVLSREFLAGRLFAGETTNRQLSAAAMLVFWTVAPPLAGLLKFDADDL